MIDIEARRATLLARKRELERRLGRIEHDLDEPAPKDFEERAVEREGDEVLAELRAIQAALRRIEDGSYGYCVACGEEISPERLDVVPHAARCRNCA